ncbi:MBL fold metallo-hydrolase [Brevibacillus fulvus]|uniref:Glyoxylase-like metal-dependent hydrolase (Beta-lactamase superfamily II) n=1 Tax=Brevibacillus fulvus TaxID=1125967 RepID=A0A939BNK7_9BACL|nr:MBL fold metallo-hydrolase [Brevibacillus fulvus]MBM7589215.1 glyoxylase-like metal-dependent hydrolase (beta-lactamase superfamily II) [Brevibacillus fulvus]
MTGEKIGPIEIIMGEKQSRAPYSTTLLIRGRQGSTLIDCGGGPAVYAYLREQNIRQILLTHFHPDHTSGAALFPEAQVLTNPFDYGRLLNQAKREADDSPYRPVGPIQLIYPYHQLMTVSETKLLMIHAPGHSDGFCCPYFPDLGVLMVGDIDLTSFGPWYFGPDSDIDQFIQSAQQTLEVDAKYFVTSHQKGMFELADYRQKLPQYLEIIEQREARLKQAVKRGCSPGELVYENIIYYADNVRQTPWILRNEQMGLAKHLLRLIDHGEPYADYYAEFMQAHRLQREQIRQLHQPSWYGRDWKGANQK